MNIVLDKNIMFPTITKLVGITEKKTLMPILSNLLIEFTPQITKIYATDLELSGVGRIDLRSPKERKIMIHGKKFQDILKEMDNGDIEFNIEENILTIKQRYSEFTFGLQDPEEFPEIKELDEGEHFHISGKIFLDMINRVGFAISNDETRFILTGMFLKSKNGKIVMVGTDGYRMALCEKDVEGLKDIGGVIIPKKSVAEIERIFEEEDMIKVTIGDKNIQFSNDHITLISRTLEGNYPDYENVIPEGNTNIAHVNKEEFFKGLKKVSTILGRSEPIKINLLKKKMEIEAESDIGKAKEVLDVDYNGADMALNFNFRFVLDVVSHIESNVITIKAPTTYGAILFEGEEMLTYKNIIMPIRM
ncbi:MAG: DNA polymerase III subunit beta [Syntrophorhabdaceae bacterium]|nr:DNA polymerase III subunit beta [Syntrophorhabdaceae bacterium]